MRGPRSLKPEPAGLSSGSLLPEEPLGFIHEPPAQPPPLLVRADGQIIDPAPVALVSHHGRADNPAAKRGHKEEITPNLKLPCYVLPRVIVGGTSRSAPKAPPPIRCPLGGSIGWMLRGAFAAGFIRADCNGFAPPCARAKRRQPGPPRWRTPRSQQGCRQCGPLPSCCPASGCGTGTRRRTPRPWPSCSSCSGSPSGRTESGRRMREARRDSPLPRRGLRRNALPGRISRVPLPG